MTWGDLIVYILENRLANEPVTDENGKLNGLLTAADVAAKNNVGIETVKVWYQTGLIQGIEINGEIYFVDITKYMPTEGDENA